MAQRSKYNQLLLIVLILGLFSLLVLMLSTVLQVIFKVWLRTKMHFGMIN